MVGTLSCAASDPCTAHCADPVFARVTPFPSLKLFFRKTSLFITPTEMIFT